MTETKTDYKFNSYLPAEAAHAEMEQKLEGSEKPSLVTKKYPFKQVKSI